METSFRGEFLTSENPAVPGSNSTRLYFKIEDQEAFLAHLERLGVSSLSVDEVVVTIVDPDGRKIMFGTA